MFQPYRREAQFLARKAQASRPSIRPSTISVWPWALWRQLTWQVSISAGAFAKSIPISIRRVSAGPIAEDRLCELGRFGQKTGAGWYKYDENRRATPDPEVAALVRQWSAQAGITQRTPSPEEIVERCVYALVNEGARVLEEGITLRAVDLDIIYLNGYGFPTYRGGPMWYADTVGLQKVYERVSSFAAPW